MTYTFLKAQGKEIGNSLCEEDKLGLATEILSKAKERNVSIILPVDSVIADAFSNDAHTKTVDNDHMEKGWMGLDIGTGSAALFSQSSWPAKRSCGMARWGYLRWISSSTVQKR